MNGTSGFPTGGGKLYRARLAGKARHARFEVPKLSTQNSELPIGSCTSNGIDSEQVPGAFSIPKISSRYPQASAQNEGRLLIP